MGKLTDIIEGIANKIGSPELADIAQNNSISDLEVDDAISTSINEKFSKMMTLDAAQNNPELVAKIKEELKPQMRKSLLNNIDETIAQHALKLLNEEQFSEVSGIERTQDRLSKVFELAESSIKNESKDSKLKDLNDQLKNQINSINSEHEKQLAKKDEELKKLDIGYKSKIIDSGLNSVLSNYELGEQYAQDFVKKALFADIKDKVRATAKLKLGENDKIIPKNLENDELDLFVENKKIENVKDIIDPLMKPYIKKTPGKKKTGDSDYKPAPQNEKISSLGADLLKRRQEKELI